MVAPFQYSGFVSVMFTYPMWDLKTSIFFNDVIDFRRSRYAFHWHVLRPSSELDHCLVYRYFLVRLIKIGEFLSQMVNDRTHLSQSILPW